MDYAAWADRAKAFVRGLAGLPTPVRLSDEIEVAAAEDSNPLGLHHREWLDSDECSLPSEIREFNYLASQRCCFQYRWAPMPPWKGRLSEYVPESELLAGGGDLCEAAAYSNYDNREWFSEFCKGKPFMQPLLERRGTPDQDALLTLMPLENDSRIALELAPAEADRGVVHASSDGQLHNLSSSFAQFLLDWESVCYLTPDPHNLRLWLDPGTGLLRPEPAKAAALRRLLNEAARR
ncbi:MAG: hypothetical protein WD403_10895 [Pirellulales bacterium]